MRKEAVRQDRARVMVLMCHHHSAQSEQRRQNVNLIQVCVTGAEPFAMQIRDDSFQAAERALTKDLAAGFRRVQ